MEDRLLFRFGYLIHASNDVPSGDALWKRLSRNWGTARFGDLTIRSHQDLAVRVAGPTALLGDAFFSAGDLSRDPLTELASAGSDRLVALLDELSGRFMVLATRGGETGAYHDALGARSLFYRESGALGIGSHPELFLHAFGDGFWPGMMRFVRSPWFGDMGAASLPTDATLFQGVLALLPNHRYEVQRRRVARYWPREARRRDGTLDEFFAAIDSYFEGFATFLRQRPVIVSITGGIDSRTLIAGFRHQGLPLKTVNWTRANIQNWEREPVGEIARYLNGEHSWIDETNDAINDEALIGARNSGNYRHPSPAVAGTARLYGALPGAIWIPGQGAVSIYGWPPPHEALADVAPESLLRQFVGSRRPLGEHGPFVRGEIEAMLDRYDFSVPVAQGYDPDDIIFWEHHTGTWSVCSINAMHAAVDSMFGFNSRHLAIAGMALPAAWRRTKKLFHEVIRRYDSKLAAIYFQ